MRGMKRNGVPTPAALLLRVATASVIALSLLSASSAQTNLVANGSFEEPTANQYWYTYFDWGQFNSLPGWQISYGAPIDLIRTRDSWTAAAGLQWAELDGNTSLGIYQDIPTMPNTAYTLKFAFSTRGDSPEQYDGVRVLWNGNVVDTIIRTDRSLNNNNWIYYTYTVVATGSLSRLEFQDAGPNSDGWGPFLDDVSLVVVPEPASLFALAAGVVGLAARRRARGR